MMQIAHTLTAVDATGRVTDQLELSVSIECTFSGWRISAIEDAQGNVIDDPPMSIYTRYLEMDLSFREKVETERYLRWKVQCYNQQYDARCRSGE